MKSQYSEQWVSFVRFLISEGLQNHKTPLATGSGGAMQEWTNPQKCRLAPTVKHTGQESADELCNIFKLHRFCNQKCVGLNNVYKLFQFLGDFVSNTLLGFAASPPERHTGTSVPRPPGLSPPNENSMCRQWLMDTLRQRIFKVRLKTDWQLSLPYDI